MNRVGRVMEEVRSSFWFVPSLIVAGSIVLAVALIEADAVLGDQWRAQWPRLFGAGADGARGMMSTIAGAMMSVVGVTFSMILVVLALASSQYTSRILMNFMRSRVTQVVLGIFAGIFTYCLIVLRTIRGGYEGAFVPSLAVFFGFVLALGGVGALMFFIHHIASSIQASSIISSVAHQTIQAFERLFPEQIGQQPDEDRDWRTLPAPDERTWHSVPAKESGYIQGVDGTALLRLARERKIVVRMDHGIGEFVVRSGTLAALALAGPPDQAMTAALQDAFSISQHRTVDEDAAFGIRQIVDVALKALSPGVIDTTTAVMCVDYLAAILAQVATRRIPSALRYEHGELRVIAKGPRFDSLLSESFDQIRRMAKGDVTIITRLLEAIQTLAGMTASPYRRGALREQVQYIAELAERTVESAHDRATVATHLELVRKALEAEPALCAREKKGF